MHGEQKIAMCQVIGIKPARRHQSADIHLEATVVRLQCRGAGQRFRVSHSMLGEPVADAADRLVGNVAAEFDVLAAEIGQRLVVAVALGIENERALMRPSLFNAAR